MSSEPWWMFQKGKRQALPVMSRKLPWVRDKRQAGGWRQLRKACLGLRLPEVGEEDGGELMTEDKSNSGRNRNGYYLRTMESNASLLQLSPLKLLHVGY